MDVRKTVLENGLTVVTEHMPSVRSISIGIWLRTGSRAESEADNGITHFLEHMVFKGTRKRSAEEIARSADSIGGHLDAFTAKECTSFSIKVLDEHLPRAFDVLADLVKNPLLRDEHINKESQVIQEEIKMVEDTPDDLVHELFTESYWRNLLGVRVPAAAIDRNPPARQVACPLCGRSSTLLQLLQSLLRGLGGLGVGVVLDQPLQ